MLEPLVTLVSIFQLHLRFHNYYTVIQFVFNFLFFSLFIHSNIYTDLAIILSTFPVYVQFNSLFLSVHSSILRPNPSPPGSNLDTIPRGSCPDQGASITSSCDSTCAPLRDKARFKPRLRVGVFQLERPSLSLLLQLHI